jgi:inositol transport system substrate-binding protein
MTAYATKLGNVELTVKNAGGKHEQQAKDVDEFIASKVQVIILNPVDAIKGSELIDKIKAANIKVLNFNNNTVSDKYDCYNGTNEVNSGKVQADYLAKLTNGGKDKAVIGILKGEPNHSGSDGRTKGLKENYLDKYKDTTKVVADEYAKWDPKVAAPMVERWIKDYPDMNYICAQNDGMALGAVAAIKQAGKTGKIKVLGIDGDANAIKAVKSGEMEVTVKFDPIKNADQGMDLAIKLAKGEPVEKNVYVEQVAISKDNVDQFLK